MSWKNRSTNQTTMRYTMDELMKEAMSDMPDTLDTDNEIRKIML
jgi:hypothetical protein